MSLQIALKQLRVLSFADMMALADELNERLTSVKNQDLSALLIANTLSHIASNEVASSDLSRQEDKILKAIFNRKRHINIEPHKAGYGLAVPTVQGSNVIGTDLRAMFPMMLDQIVTLHILSKP